MRELRAKDIMTKNILKVREDWSIHRLAEFFAENFISGAPVTTEDGKLIGVVSLTDIIQQGTLTEQDTPSYEPHEYYLHTLEDRYTREEIASLQIKGEPMFTTHDVMRFITAYGRKDVFLAARKIGVNDFIDKPLKVQNIEESLSLLIEGGE